MNNNRPRHLALHLIKLPLSGIVSILHRISGLLLFLALPLLLLILEYSLQSIQTYTRLIDTLHQPLSRLILLVLLWAFLHHFVPDCVFWQLTCTWYVTLPNHAVAASWCS